MYRYSVVSSKLRYVTSHKIPIKKSAFAYYEIFSSSQTVETPFLSERNNGSGAKEAAR